MHRNQLPAAQHASRWAPQRTDLCLRAGSLRHPRLYVQRRGLGGLKVLHQLDIVKDVALVKRFIDLIHYALI